MADQNALELIRVGERLFTKKAQLDEMHQRLAEVFYPERANFTVSRLDGDEYAQDMYESIPAQNRRDLAGAIGSILRPRGKEWFKPSPGDDWRKTQRALEWCDNARDTLRRILYGDRTMFQKVWADGDDDFVSFGNAIPVLTENVDRNGFLFELSHPRDNAWMCNRYNQVDVNHRKMKMTLRNMAKRWGEKSLSQGQRTALEKHPDQEGEIRHVVMPADDYEPYGSKKKLGGKPIVSVYINPESACVCSENGYWEFPYLHRRWRVPTDSVYGYSPASMLGLVDARVLQSQARVILDAGELSVAPPLLAKRDAVLGGVNNFAGAVTWLDMEYDERFGEAIRALDVGGDVRLGLEMKVDTRAVLQAAWYLNKLNLPSDKEMTAYETSERIAEYIRSAGPIFEPFEADNARMLDALFSMCLRLGYFGPIESIPPEIRGGEIKWEFDTPVSQAYARMKVTKARETLEAYGMAVQADPRVRHDLDVRKIFRDTATNIGGETDWLTEEEEANEAVAQEAAKMEEMEQMQKLDALLGAADKGAGAGQKASVAAQGIPGLAMQLQQMFGGMGGQPIEGGQLQETPPDIPEEILANLSSGQQAQLPQMPSDDEQAANMLDEVTNAFGG